MLDRRNKILKCAFYTKLVSPNKLINRNHVYHNHLWSDLERHLLESKKQKQKKHISYLKKKCIPELCPSSEAFLGLHNYHRIDVNKVKSESKASPRRQVTVESYGFPMTSHQVWRSTPNRLVMPGFIGNKAKSSVKSCDDAGDVIQGLAWFPLPELKTKKDYIHKTLTVGTTHSSSSHGRAAV